MKIWFTLTGTNHYLGSDFLEKGMKIRLEKEPDNRHDREAIKVLLDGVGHIGYVANSSWTVLGESYSAGRLYDKIGDTARGKVRVVTDRGVLCTLKRKKEEEPPRPDRGQGRNCRQRVRAGVPGRGVIRRIHRSGRDAENFLHKKVPVPPERFCAGPYAVFFTRRAACRAAARLFHPPCSRSPVLHLLLLFHEQVNRVGGGG